MAKCVVKECKNKRLDKKPGITFHLFPREEEHRKSWEAALNREGFEASIHSLICSVHFKPEDFDRSSPFVTKIHKGVVPSIFPEVPKNLQKTTKGRRSGKRKSEQSLTSSPKNKTRREEELKAKENASQMEAAAVLASKFSKELFGRRKKLKVPTDVFASTEKRLEKNGEVPSISSLSPKHREKFLGPVADPKELLTLVYKNLSEPRKNDECDRIGAMWAQKLRGLEPVQRLLAEKEINDVLFEAATGTLSPNTIKIKGVKYDITALRLVK